MMAVHKLCGITDPFCPHAKGARWPDGNGSNTLTYQARGLLNLVTTVDGASLSYLGATLPFNSLPPGAYGAPTFTMNAAFQRAGTNSNWQAYASTYRVVTAGIIIRNILPAMTAQGILVITRMTTFPSLGASVTTGLLNQGEVYTVPITAGMEIPLLFSPVGIDARDFKSQNINTTINDGWNVYKIEVIGSVASASVITIELVYNIEFTLIENYADMSTLSTVENPISIASTTIATKLTNSIGTVIYNGASKFSSLIATKAAQALGTYFGGPAGGMAAGGAMAIMVD